MKYKKLVFFVLFVGGACLLYHPLLCLGMRVAVAFVFSSAEKTSYEKITWENSRLLLKNLHVQDSAYQIRVDTVSCAFSLSGISLDILHPEITVSTWTEEKGKLPPLGLLAFIETKIEHGVLAFKESPRLYFSLKPVELGKQLLELSYDPHGDPFCQIVTQITRQYADVHIDLKEVPSAHLSPLLGACLKGTNYRVNQAEGLVSLTGGAVVGTQGNLLSLECLATLKHFKLLEPCLVSAEHLAVDVSYLPETLDLPFWKHAKMALTVGGGSIEVQPGIFLEGLYGNVQGTDFLLFDLVGNLRKEQNQVPFILKGGGNVSEINLGCVLAESSSLSCKVALSDTDYQIVAHMEGMKGEYGTFFTDTPIQGIYQGIISLEGHGKTLQKIHVEKLQAENVCVGDLVCAENVSGRAELYFASRWHIQSSECVAKACAFQYGQYVGRDLDFTLKWEKEALESLDLTGEICGLQGIIKTSASDQTSLLDFAFKGSLRQALSQDLSCEVAGSLFQDVSDPLDPHYDLLGTLTCEREPLEFGASFEKMTFLEGWVQKKGLKVEAFLPFLQPYLPSLRSEGTLDVLATLDAQGCEVICFSPEGMCVAFQGNSLTLPSFDSKSMAPAVFSYHWSEGKIKGRIPLKEASLSLGDKGWSIANFSGDLVVEEGHFLLEQYQASCLGIPIQGKAELFFKTGFHDFLSVVSAHLPATYPISDLKLSLQYDEKRDFKASFVATEKTVPIATLSASAEKKEGLWNWQVEPSSHILGVILNVETLKTAGTEVEALLLKPTLPCKIIPYALNFLEKLRFPIDPSFSTEVKNLNLEGMIAFNLCYAKHQKWRFQGKGEKLLSKGKPLGDVLCRGRSDGKTLFIESLEMQNLKLKAHLTQEERGYALSAVEGTWDGILFSGKALWNSQEAILSGEAGFIYQDPLQITLKTQENIAFSYSETGGLKAAGLLCDLYDTPSKAHLGTIRVSRGSQLHGTTSFESLQFSLSPTILKRWEGKLPGFLEMFSVEGYVEGEGNLDYGLEGLTFKGSLKNGNYRFKEERLALEKIAVTYDHAILGLRFKTSIQELVPLWVEAHINTGEAPYGMIRVTPTLQEPGIKALFKTEKGRCLLDSVKGSAYGITASLEKSKGSYLRNAHILSGSCAVDFKALKVCFSPEIQKKIQALKLGSGYAFQGDFVFPEGKEMTASGKLFGSHTEFLGFAFETLTAKLLYSPSHIEIADLKLLDPAGIIEMKKMLCDKGAEWSFAIPLLQIKDLIPSALKTVDSPPSSEKPFAITQCLLEGIRGKLSDPMTWEGQGMMHFTNTAKKESSFWDAPLDLIRKLGLDPGLLVPICGDIDLKLAGDKLYLDHLKNAYSEGERAQFFLSVDNPSYIDLDGNIRVDIRMRQDVVLKFTEKLLLTIRGTLEKPKYGLQY